MQSVHWVVWHLIVISLIFKWWSWLQSFFREKRLAKKYYDKLFKEYCISDLSRYKENKVTDKKVLFTAKPMRITSSYLIWLSLGKSFWQCYYPKLQVALRWRIEKEVIEGKGVKRSLFINSHQLNFFHKYHEHATQ